MTDSDRNLMSYVEKLTLKPDEMESSDVTALRKSGFSDKAILETTHICGFFNHINRVADALGVEPEPEWKEMNH